MTTETLRIEGITYEVVRAMTPETAAAQGYANISAAMIQNGHTRDLYLRRPKGRVHYFVVEYINRYSNQPIYGNVVSLGGVR